MYLARKLSIFSLIIDSLFIARQHSTAMQSAIANTAMSVCLSVCLSVIRWYCVKAT